MNIYKFEDGKANKLFHTSNALLEKEIEDYIENNSIIPLGEPMLIIGRQVITATRGIIDLLGIDSSGRLVVVELKKGSATKDIIDQILGYYTWIKSLSYQEIENIALEYLNKKGINYKSISSALKDFFKNTDIKLNHTQITNLLFAEEYSFDHLNQIEKLQKDGVNISAIKFNILTDTKNIYFLVDFVTETNSHLHSQPPSPSFIKSGKLSSNTSSEILLDNLKKHLMKRHDSWLRSIFNGKMGYHKGLKNPDWKALTCEWKTSEGDVQIGFGLELNEKKYIARIAFQNTPRVLYDSELLRLLEAGGYSKYSFVGEDNYWRSRTKYIKILKHTNDSLLANLTINEVIELAESEMGALKKIILRIKHLIN